MTEEEKIERISELSGSEILSLIRIAATAKRCRPWLDSQEFLPGDVADLYDAISESEIQHPRVIEILK